MRLKQDKKLRKNLKLLKTCSQVRVIELTEKLENLKEQKMECIKNSDFRTLSNLDKNMNSLERKLIEHKNLNELLEAPTSFEAIIQYLNEPDHSKAFRTFSENMQNVPAIVLNLQYKRIADTIAERIGIANSTYYSNSERTFTKQDVEIALNKDFQGRLKNTGVKMVAGLALSATLFGAGFSTGRNTTQQTPAETIEHTAGSTLDTITPQINSEEDIFSNSVNIKDYETACQDYFEKVSEIYKSETGENVDLSGYGQENIGRNTSANILVVDYNGQKIEISTQGTSASNYTYLKKAIEATAGANYTEKTSATTYIIDKNNSEKSIAIADAEGNPVRSGNILTGSNNAYNSDYVALGKEILVSKGRNSSSLTEAECVGAYLLSDKYNDQNPELSKAVGEVQELSNYIKNHFYIKNGKEDSYAVSQYAETSKRFTENYKSTLEATKTLEDASRTKSNGGFEIAD
jgi:hypothetical protein